MRLNLFWNFVFLPNNFQRSQNRVLAQIPPSLSYIPIIQQKQKYVLVWA